jgi:hypothetical protein
MSPDAPIDAAPPDAPPAPVLGDGTLIVLNDTWCEVSIDGVVQSGKLTAVRKSMRVAAGHHVVTCAQPGINPGWSREVDVVPGKAIAVQGTMLVPVEVTIAVTGDSVQIDEGHYRRGMVARLKPGRYKAVVMHGDKGGASGWLSIPRVASCQLHDQGNDIVCDP